MQLPHFCSNRIYNDFAVLRNIFGGGGGGGRELMKAN